MDKKLPKVQKIVIKREELQQMESDSEAAKTLLTSEEFKFFRDYLVREKEAIVTDFVTNRIHKTVEVKPQIGGGTVEITHTKEEQSVELSGKFNFIFELLAYLENVKNLPKDAFSAEEKGRVTIESKKE